MAKESGGASLVKGLSEQTPCTGSPAEYGMDNKSDAKNQKPMSTPKKGVTEKGKKFTIC